MVLDFYNDNPIVCLPEIPTLENVNHVNGRYED